MSPHNNKGFALGAVVAAMFLISSVVVLGTKATDTVRSAQRYFNSAGVKNSLSILRDYLIQNSADPDNDGHYELPKEGTGNTIPLSIPVSPADSYGTNYRYCTWDAGAPNTVDGHYSQNNVAPPTTGLIGRIISAGADKTFQTSCTDATANGDDVMLDIAESSVNWANASLGGWKDNGSYISQLNPTNNIGIGTTVAPTHKMEFAAGTTAAEGLAMGDVELFRSGANTLTANVTGGSLNIDGGSIQLSGSTLVDASRNITANNVTASGGTITLDNATSNMIQLGNAGLAPPSTSSRSIGTKIVLWSLAGGGLADYAIGVDTNTLWQSVHGGAGAFKWYAGTSNIMTLDGTGHLGVGAAPNSSYAINTGAINATALYINGAPFVGGNIDAGTAAGQTLYWDGTKWTATSGVVFNSGTGSLNISAGDLQLGGTSVLNSSRNLVGVNALAQNLLPLVNNAYSLGGGAGSQLLNIYGQNLYQNGNKVLDNSAVSGNANYISKFTGTNSLGNSQLYDDGFHVGINTTTPKSQLDVNGGVAIGSVYAGTTTAPANGLLVSGNTGLGVATPDHRLDVVGTIRAGWGNNGGKARGYLGGIWATTESYKFATLGSTYFDGTNWITNEGTNFGSNNVSTLGIDAFGIKFYTAASTGNTVRTDSTATFNTYERMRLTMNGSLLIGATTTTPDNELLRVHGAITTSTGTTGAYTTLRANNNTQSLLNMVPGSGGYAMLDINVMPTDGVSQGVVRIGRSTNTTGGTSLQIFKGDNTATVNHQLNGAGPSALSVVSGNLMIGTSTDDTVNKLQVNGSVAIQGRLIERTIDATSMGIMLNTADGTDNQRLQITGAGGPGVIRGAYINLHGNEHALYPGALSLLAGYTGSEYINFFTGNGMERMRISSDGKMLVGTTGVIASSPALIQTTGGIQAINIASGYNGYSSYNSISVTRSDQSGAGQNDKTVMDVVSGTGAARFGQINADAGTLSGEYRINRDGTHTWSQGSSSSEKMRLDTVGSLLIGTTASTIYSPAGKALNLAATSSTARIAIQGATTGDYSAIDFGSGAQRNGVIQGNTDGSLAFYTNNLAGNLNVAERMRITSAGNLLIGMTVDDTVNKLQVNGSLAVKSGGASILGSTNNNMLTLDFLNFRKSSTSAVIEGMAGGNMFIRSGTSSTAGGNIIIGDSWSGNVLVGGATDNGTDKLQVNGSARITGYPLTIGDTTNSAVKRSYIVGTQYGSAAEPEGFLLMGGYSDTTSNNSLLIGGGITTANAATVIGFYTAADAVTHIGTERARITSNGNLLVGTYTDNGTDKLQVNGSVLATSMTLSGTNPTPLQVVRSTAGNANIYYSSSNGNMYAGLNSSGGWAIGHNQDLGNSPLLTVTTGGNVLIGTATDSGNKLSVTGTGYFSGDLAVGGNISVAGENFFQSSVGTSYSTQLHNTSWGQGSEWLVNMTHAAGVDPITNMTFTVNPGTYNTGAGGIRYDGNARAWKFLVTGISTGAGTAAAVTIPLTITSSGLTANVYTVAAGASSGLGFNGAGPTSYGIRMADTASAGAIYTPGGVYDYNMYFTMTGGAGRGFVYKTDNGSVAQIDGYGNLYTRGYIYPGTGSAGQTSKFIYYDSANTAIRTNGGMVVDGAFKTSGGALTVDTSGNLTTSGTITAPKVVGAVYN